MALVGLNESGKTTIIEAISYWYERINIKDEEALHNTGILDPKTLIPRPEQFNFTNITLVEAVLKFESEDITRLNRWAEKYGYKIIRDESLSEITYSIEI